MDNKAYQNPPYFDWSLDGWKIGLIVVLFLFVLFGTLYESTWSGTSARNSPAMSDIASEPEQAPIAVELVTVQSSAEEQTGRNSADVPSAAALPLTLSTLGPNAVVSSNGIASLSGTGESRARVEVRDQLIVESDAEALSASAAAEELLGVATVDDRGFWTVPLIDVLAPGRHIITVREVDGSGSLLSVSSPVVVRVLGDGEQGPPSLATPQIRFPAPAARLRTGPIVFMGSGMPGMRVRLALNGESVAEGTVNSREEWRLSITDALVPGIYVVQVEALDPQGDLAAVSPPVAFSVVEPVEDSEGTPGRAAAEGP